MAELHRPGHIIVFLDHEGFQVGDHGRGALVSFVAGLVQGAENDLFQGGIDIRVVPMIDTAWRERREELLTAADKVTVLLRMPSAGQGGESAQEVVARTLGDLRSNFDPEYGGFGGPPKFPTPHTLIFLVRTFQSRGDPDLLSMAEKTLQAMHAGGIYDHAGFGFHRYSMDASWLVPHFEKMLYDQALLAMAYTEAFRVTGQARYRAIAGEIFTYMIRDLRGSEGAFYSAEDAESGGKGGRVLSLDPG